MGWPARWLTRDAQEFFQPMDHTVHNITESVITFANPMPTESLGRMDELDRRQTSSSLLTTSQNVPAITTISTATSPWVAYQAGITTRLATNTANIDRVNSLAIAAPGLASGVHVNGDAGQCVLCRFPVTGTRGSVIQFEPINPIKSTYPLQGSTISDLHIELLDQNGQRVETQGEGYSCTIVVEYDMD